MQNDRVYKNAQSKSANWKAPDAVDLCYTYSMVNY